MGTLSARTPKAALLSRASFAPGSPGSTTGLGQVRNQNCAAQTTGPISVIKFAVQGNSWVFVGSDSHIQNANIFFATDGSGGAPSPTGGTFSMTSSDSGDSSVAGSLAGLPTLKITTQDQSSASNDRTLTFKYTVNGGSAIRPMNVTARMFHAVTNPAPSNQCTQFGATYQLTYTPYTSPITPKRQITV
jgi:hypothetical protein